MRVEPSRSGWTPRPELHGQLYAPAPTPALNNLGGYTADQHEAAERLRAANLPAVALLFGRSAH